MLVKMFSGTEKGTLGFSPIKEKEMGGSGPPVLEDAATSTAAFPLVGSLSWRIQMS